MDEKTRAAFRDFLVALKQMESGLQSFKSELEHVAAERGVRL